jgi:creatinine amidohydrolase
MRWEEQSWPEISQADRDMPVVIPLGSCEQHGRHLPLFVDTIQVTEIAQLVEADLNQSILLLPTLWLGSSHIHKDFPGTISVKPSLYTQMIQEVARSIIRAGFRRLLFLNGHGGNRVPAANALCELSAEDDDADDVYLVLSSWWEIGTEGILPDTMGLEQKVMQHACEYETSLMMVLKPGLVDVSKITPRSPPIQNDWYNCDTGSRRGVSVFRRHHRLTAEGSMGHPESASAEKGAGILDGVRRQIVAFLTEFAQWPQLPVIGPRSP